MKQLDLHGVRHQEVDRMVENFILCNQGQLPLTIVCGNSITMLKLVDAVTKRLGCETYVPQYGTVIIRRL